MRAFATGRAQALPSLGALRVFAVCLVFLRHERASYSVWREIRVFDLGFVAVSFFFILSGFVLAWSQRDEETRGDFYRKRFARIYPVHLATWLLIFPLYAYAGLHIAGGVAALTLVLIQAWVPMQSVYFGMNGVTWFLSCLAFFYAIYPLVYAKMADVSSHRRWIVAIFLLSMGAAVSLLAGFTTEAGDMAAYVNPAVRLGEFLLGITLAIELRRGWRPRVAPSFVTTLFLAATGGAVALSFGSGPVFGPANTLMIVPFALVIVLVAQRDLRGEAPLLAGPVARHLAKISFSFFLVHLMVIALARKALGPPGTIAEAIPRLTSDFGLCVIAASVLYYVVEVPGRRVILRFRWARGSTPRPAAGDAPAQAA
jgi:peptidoglycan/LPS O-acetylase OafA/YrhL